MNSDKCRQGESIQISRRIRSSVSQHESTKNAPAKIPTSHKTYTEATATLTRGQIVAPQNKWIVTRRKSVNNKMIAGKMSLQEQEDSRTLEHSSLEEGEIIEGGSPYPARCPVHRKRQRQSYKVHDSESTTGTPSKFWDKVEIVDVQQVGSSVRKRKLRHKMKKQSSTSGDRQGTTVTSDACSASRKASHLDSSRPTILDRPQNMAGDQSDGGRVTDGGLEEATDGGQKEATDGGLEEGELSHSYVPGNLSTNELLSQCGSDMSISSEDSLTEETVAKRQLKDSCLLNNEGSWQGSNDKMFSNSLMSSTAAESVDSNLDPLATVFVPQCLTVPDPAHQPNMPHSQPWPKFNAHSHFTEQQEWPTFNAHSHFTQQQQKDWPKFNAHSHFTQQQDWPKYQTPGHFPQKQHSNIAHCFNPYSDNNPRFAAPYGGMFSSVSSIWSYLPVTQRQSQWARVPFLQPSLSALQASEMWATSSRAAGLESGGPTFALRIHINPTAIHTCSEITNTSRHWQTVRQADVETGGMELKIMCYNILSQELMDRHMYLYTRCRDTDLQWENRGAALLTQIMAHNADIVCLQEVENDHWEQDIRDTLAEQGYAGVYKKQTGDNSHGCAILFKASKFQLLKSIPVEFLKGGILDRHNIGLILLLQPHKQVYGGKVQKICVATTHLLFNPRRGDVKLAQLMVLLAEIDKYAYLDDQAESGHKCCPVNGSSRLDQESQSAGHQSSPEIYQAAGCEQQLKNTATCGKNTTTCGKNTTTCGSAGYCPIILCGDFNSEPLCDLYQFLTTGYLKYEDCMSRLLCGQEEGRWGGSDRFLDRKLLPTSLNICETCQYLHVLKERHNRAGERGRGLLPKVNSGKVWHGMNFQSAYSHCVSQGHGEISTYHNNCCCTVDYIFYSRTGPPHVRGAHFLEGGDSRASQVDDSQSHIQGGSQSHIQGGSQSHIQGGSQSHIQGGSQSHIQGGSQSHIQGGSQSHIQGGSQSHIQGGSQSHIQGGSQSHIQGGSQSHIQGGSQSHIQGGSQSHIQGGSQSHIQGGSQSHIQGGSQSHIQGGSQSHIQGGSQSHIQGGSQSHIQGGSQSHIQGGSQSHIQGGSQSHIQGGSQLDRQGGRDKSRDVHTDTDMTATVVDTDRPTFKEPLELVARYRLLTKNEVTKYGFMPNSVFPSDHLCLIAKFVLR